MLAIVLCLVGAILLAAGKDKPRLSYAPDPVTGVQMFGAGLLGMAGTLLVAWLVCKALLWRPEE